MSINQSNIIEMTVNECLVHLHFSETTDIDIITQIQDILLSSYPAVCVEEK